MPCDVDDSQGAENSQSLTAGANAQSLAEAADLGITITRCKCHANLQSALVKQHRNCNETHTLHKSKVSLLLTQDSQVTMDSTRSSFASMCGFRKIFLQRSPAFVVDAAPSAGHIQMSPVQGEALKTSFTFSTNGWSDEDFV